jgi:hypothetical protein
LARRFHVEKAAATLTAVGRAGRRGAEMPSLGAAVAAMLAGWVIDDIVQPVLGLGPTLFLSFVASTIVFFMARKWLLDLRGR